MFSGSEDREPSPPPKKSKPYVPKKSGSTFQPLISSKDQDDRLERSLTSEVEEDTIHPVEPQPQQNIITPPRQVVTRPKDEPVATPVDMTHPEFRFELLNIAAVDDVVRAILKDHDFNKNIVVEKGMKFSGYQVIELDSQKKVVRIQGPDGTVTDLTRKPHGQSQKK
ncbi:hypothetical protein SH661x_002846 [Planctomicrobium sp. SH661]|uniref:hypothetical protein n=1 Tax=Planctomicrobium sp. SH661 TaxID=3448124 RepID=UPI003F5B750E